METVWIKHPNLPGQETKVPVQSLPHYFRSGWQEFTPGPAEATDVIDSDEPSEESGEKDKSADEPPSESATEPTAKRASSVRRATATKGDVK